MLAITKPPRPTRYKIAPCFNPISEYISLACALDSLLERGQIFMKNAIVAAHGGTDGNRLVLALKASEKTLGSVDNSHR